MKNHPARALLVDSYEQNSEHPKATRQLLDTRHRQMCVLLYQGKLHAVTDHILSSFLCFCYGKLALLIASSVKTNADTLIASLWCYVKI